MASVAQSAIANLKAAGLGDVVYSAGESSYQAREKSYWSLSQRAGPWAIVQPRNTEEVSKAVKALVDTPGLKFAVRSGGHMWAGHSNNITEGITIDLGLLDKTTYNPETKLASLEPGSRWNKTYNEVVKQGVLIVGGRDREVGVGGFLIGGGISFYTCRYGWGCDQVANFEVVLADGSIVQANRDSHPDLFRVLKGGIGNFGIVTRFDVNTFPAKPFWDGVITCGPDATDKIIAAYVDFSSKLAETPDNQCVIFFNFFPSATKLLTTVLLTNLDNEEKPKSLAMWEDIPGQHDFSSKMLTEKVETFHTASEKYDCWVTSTFYCDARLVKRSITEFEALIEKLKGVFPGANFKTHLVVQPLIPDWAKHGQAQGGNVFGIENLTGGDCVNLLLGVEVDSLELMKSAVEPAAKTMFANIKEHAASLGKDVDFLYLNYCAEWQNPLATYGVENIKLMKEAAKKYDPTGVFQDRIPGGFKISKVE
ncbi:FAD-binding domain-containing protein [Hypomontagnella submonticulosa]|nr:FAD-binding domain-containing protein [Hypomontagnella submonticulosa]